MPIACAKWSGEVVKFGRRFGGRISATHNTTTTSTGAAASWCAIEKILIKKKIPYSWYYSSFCRNYLHGLLLSMPLTYPTIERCYRTIVVLFLSYWSCGQQTFSSTPETTPSISPHHPTANHYIPGVLPTAIPLAVAAATLTLLYPTA